MKSEVFKIRRWICGKKEPPLTMELLFGEGCNQNCKFCSMYNQKGTPLGNYEIKNKLSDKDYSRLIDECGKLEVKRIQLSGDGEPLYDKKMTISLMKKIKDYNIYGYLNTNGSLFTEKDIKLLVEKRWDMILFSVMGPDAKTHDYLVGLPGAFNKVIKNIKLFNKWKKKLNKNIPEIELKMVLTNKNYNKIADMVKLSQKLNVHLRLDSLIIFHKQGKRLALNFLQKLKFKKYLKMALSLSKTKNLRFNVSDELLVGLTNKKEGDDVIKNLQLKKIEKNKFLSSPCYLPWLRILINPEGFVGPCGFYITEENIKNQNLKTIWFGETYSKLRTDRLSHRLGRSCHLCGDIEYNAIIQKKLNDPESNGRDYLKD